MYVLIVIVYIFYCERSRLLIYNRIFVYKTTLPTWLHCSIHLYTKPNPKLCKLRRETHIHTHSVTIVNKYGRFMAWYKEIVKMYVPEYCTFIRVEYNDTDKASPFWRVVVENRKFKMKFWIPKIQFRVNWNSYIQHNFIEHIKHTICYIHSIINYTQHRMWMCACVLLLLRSHMFFVLFRFLSWKPGYSLSLSPCVLTFKSKKIKFSRTRHFKRCRPHNIDRPHYFQECKNQV